MGSLRQSFKTDIASANNGIVVQLMANPNNDEGKTIPTFRVARYSMQNKEFAKVVRKVNDNALKKYGVLSIDKLTPEQSKEMSLDIFVEAVLKGWDNFQPETDGVNLQFTKGNAKEIFSNEEWYDLYERLQKESMSQENFSKELAEASAKN
jgi:hypothetical protein